MLKYYTIQIKMEISTDQMGMRDTKSPYLKTTLLGWHYKIET